MKIMYEIIVNTKSNQIYNHLRNLIICGEFGPSDKLNIAELARKFGVSEIPIREALCQLEECNLVKRVAYKGFFVNPISYEDWRNNWLIRDALESLAIDQVIANFVQTDFNPLEKILIESSSYLSKNDLESFGSMNRIFHLTMYRIAKNPKLIQMIDEIWDETERAVKLFKYKKSRASKSLSEHWEMLNTLKKKDSFKMKELLNNHRKENFEILDKLWKDQEVNNSSEGYGVNLHDGKTKFTVEEKQNKVKSKI